MQTFIFPGAKSMDQTQFDKLNRRILTYAQDVVQIQKELTAIPALSPENGGDGETRKAESIKKILDRLEFEKMIQIDAPDNRVTEGKRPNLIAQMKGKSNQKTIWIMSHMDVVPPGDTSLWMTEPYTAVEKDGKIFGRGTEDNQQAIAASILAIKALREEHILPEYELGLAIVSDEETGSEFGIKYILRGS
jgi:succinyl-diaminopimelate desuccinylase